MSVLATPLDDYVNTPDPNYAWTDTGIVLDGPDGAYKGYVLNMTSQRWLTDADTTRSIWWHTLVIIVPKYVIHKNSGFLWITGGNNENWSPPKNTDEDIEVTAYTACATHTIGAALFQVPNQHMIFHADPLQQSRSEDAIIAYTWMHFINDTSTPEWLLRLPMTKAAVRALDTMAAWAVQHDPAFVLDEFYVAGASKRGWTTWTTAAVDKRVKAMAPIVMDELNFVKNIHHHYRAYGGWTFALSDYYVMNFTSHIDDPNTQTMMDIIDPISYIDRYVGMPKLVCDAGGDEFFLPDDWTFWWDQMPEPKHSIMVPNAEHSMATGILELLPAVATFFSGVLNKDSIPQVNWTIDDVTGEITVKVSEEPLQAHLWYAETCNTARRDFRLVNIDDPCTCGLAQQGVCINLKVLWLAEPLGASAPLTFTALRPAPVDGRWTAFFIDVQFKRPLGFTEAKPIHVEGWPFDPPGTYEFTSGVSILPKTYPYPDCEGVGCYGTLL